MSSSTSHFPITGEQVRQASGVCSVLDVLPKDLMAGRNCAMRTGREPGPRTAESANEGGEGSEADEKGREERVAGVLWAANRYISI